MSKEKNLEKTLDNIPKETLFDVFIRGVQGESMNWTGVDLKRVNSILMASYEKNDLEEAKKMIRAIGANGVWVYTAPLLNRYKYIESVTVVKFNKFLVGNRIYREYNGMCDYLSKPKKDGNV